MRRSAARARSAELESPTIDRYTSPVFAVARMLLSGLGVASVLSLSACGRQQTCVLPDEPPRVLNLTQGSDRVHLAADLATVDRLAQAYGRWAAAHPPRDTRFVTATRLEQHARAYCQALLAQKISVMHGVDMPRLERALADQQARLSQR
jgi:hypothetical protein